MQSEVTEMKIRSTYKSKYIVVIRITSTGPDVEVFRGETPHNYNQTDRDLLKKMMENPEFRQLVEHKISLLEGECHERVF